MTDRSVISVRIYTHGYYNNGNDLKGPAWSRERRVHDGVIMLGSGVRSDLLRDTDGLWRALTNSEALIHPLSSAKSRLLHSALPALRAPYLGYTSESGKVAT
jgi:hypothetical protein